MTYELLEDNIRHAEVLSQTGHFAEAEAMIDEVLTAFRQGSRWRIIRMT